MVIENETDMAAAFLTVDTATDGLKRSASQSKEICKLLLYLISRLHFF